MPSDARHTAFTAITAILLFGTLYSIVYNTYLDTSNPLLTHLPHPLSHSHYFATKANFLNVYFIKKAWGWTSAAFLFSFFTSPPSARTGSRIIKFLAESAIWVLFTSWFFGPALLERVIAASGGECVIALPSGDPISVPNEYCYTRSTITPASHPDLFITTFALPNEWKAVPRLRKGHDISGHVFLLTMSILFLADQLRPSFRAKHWSNLHKWAIATNIALIGIWLFASYTTSVYFHSPFEKFTGYLLGVASFAVTQYPWADYLFPKSRTTSLTHQKADVHRA
ncbi:inositol phospholipid synthesis and fat-storage-inducing TM-domain-containing protein [Crucibulum laeve]|uniref:Inositol phospholipid synthesis and fat-storage-inducing TM-domain-containing protein n=1 Tax=Crucibulum laeve TaxID=68775 RepID=A0A5C3MTY2_9AGAR|nr:inositol phospholipid synthesis and fat-storage-inducing TM-domain-containing protein [Crucibulum laeve]